MKKDYCKPAALVVKIQAVSMMATSDYTPKELDTTEDERTDYTAGGYDTW